MNDCAGDYKCDGCVDAKPREDETGFNCKAMDSVTLNAANELETADPAMQVQRASNCFFHSEQETHQCRSRLYNVSIGMEVQSCTMSSAKWKSSVQKDLISLLMPLHLQRRSCCPIHSCCCFYKAVEQWTRYWQRLLLSDWQIVL